MDKRASSGFTIIETMLFLAVTGALLIGIMLTIGSTVSAQRYRDAVDSFKSLVQQQYTDVNNIQNVRTNEFSCNTQGRVVAGTILRGQSACVAVGKYMTIEGGAIRIYPVVAYEVPNAAEPADDITSLTSTYRLNVTSIGMREDEMRWGTRIGFTSGNGANAADSNGSSPRALAILFVRSPKTGQMYTFTSNTVPVATSIASGTDTPTFLREMIVTGESMPGQRARTVCIDSSDLLSTGLAGKTALYIPSYASNPSSIELRSNEIMATKGPERCNS